MNTATHSNEFKLKERAAVTEDQPLAKTNDKQAAADAYWKANISLLLKLLAVWFVVSFGFGILLVEPLNTVTFLGVKLGFWFAQQGSIYVFVVLIFLYAWQMKRLERRFGVDD